MSLRTRISALSTLMIILVLVSGYLVASWSIDSGYRQLEDTAVKAQMRSAQGAIGQMLNSLGGTANLMALVAARDQSLLQLPKLADSVLADGFLILNPDGSVGTHAQRINLAELAPHIGLDSPILQNSLYSSSLPEGSGVLQLASGPVLIAWYVLPSPGGAESQPVLVLLKQIRPEEIVQSAGLPGMSLSILSAKAKENADITTRIREDLLDGEGMVVEPVDESTIRGYKILTDIYGEPAILLQGTFNRDLYAQGLSSRSQLLWSLLISGLILSAAVFLLLYRYGLVRIERLVGEVEDIRASGDLSRRVSASGHDEIGLLIKGINQMLVGLELAHLERLRSEQRHRVVIEQMTEGVVIFTPEGKILDINPALERMLGYAPGRRVGDSILGYLAIPEAEASRAIQEVVVSGDPLRSQIALRQADGDPIEVEISLARVDWDGQVSVCASVHDIGERLRFESELRHQAHHDVLTGLPNRLLLANRLDEALEEAGQSDEVFALMFVDLNRFKDINDTLGHAAGDRLLQEIAHRLTLIVRNRDTVARVGGDEFCLILRGIGDSRQAAVVAERLALAIGESLQLEPGAEFYPSASIGIALYPRDGRTVDELMRRSDQAMYQAKGSPGGTQAIFFNEALAHPRTARELLLIQGLRGAIERGEMALHYQPIVDLATRKLVAVEALLRWNHPELGLLSPGEFLYLAEESGNANLLGEWVLSQALSQNRIWQLDGYPPFRAVVNVSLSQFRWPGFTQAVTRILDQAGVAPRCLELEISEHALGQATEARLREMRALRRRGVKVMLSEFGSGFTGLTRLSSLPIDGVKLSWGLVDSWDQETSPEGFGKRVLTMVTSRTASWNIYCVVTGIETEEQYLSAYHSGCREGQGYLFGGPVPADILGNLVRAGVLG